MIHVIERETGEIRKKQCLKKYALCTKKYNIKKILQKYYSLRFEDLILRIVTVCLTKI